MMACPLVPFRRRARSVLRLRPGRYFELLAQTGGKLCFDIIRCDPQIGKLALRAGVGNALDHEEAPRQPGVAHPGGMQQKLSQMLDLNKAAPGARRLNPRAHAAPFEILARRDDRSQQFGSLSLRHALPAIFTVPEFVGPVA